MADKSADPPIRDAATLVIVDRSGAGPRVLMGRRRATQVFLPNVFVFPGGRVDDDDAGAPSADDVPEAEAALLSIPRAGHAPYSAGFVRSLPLAALRETFEETGLAVGIVGGLAAGTAPAAAKAPEPWRPFLATGVMPKLSSPQFFLRAITPTKRLRRYDTRFFLVDAADIAHQGTPMDDELSELDWFDFRSLAALDVPSITRVVIQELQSLVKDGLKPAADRRVPFHFEHNDVMHRAELSLPAARS